MLGLTDGTSSTARLPQGVPNAGTWDTRQEADRCRDTRRQGAASLPDPHRRRRLARRTGAAPSGVDTLDLPPLWRVCRLPTGRTAEEETATFGKG